MRVAAVQLASTGDRARNLEAAEGLVRAAAASGAELVVLPEMVNVLGDPETLRQGAETLDGPTLTWARDLSHYLRVWLVAGSITERIPGQARHGNTSCLIDPDGLVRATYRKIHLFDCDVPGAAFHESQVVQPGREVVVTEAGDARLGLAICYDLRFPELFRILALRGARTVALPSAFTERTGRDHWEPLVRSRAIENQVFVVAANQVGSAVPGFRWFGRSMIVDPWGVVLAQAPDQETYILADLDFTAQDAIRRQLPCLRHRRPDAYPWPRDEGNKTETLR
jgi:predicted amidohydrolase